MPSGRIIAWGLVSGSIYIALPYTRKALPGAYDLVCGMLRGRVAFAAMRFSPSVIATWEAAHWDFDGIPEDRRNREQWMRVVDGIPRFDIGNGNTCFLDASIARSHNEWVRATRGGISLRMLQAGKRDAEFLAAVRDAVSREAPDPMDRIVDRQDVIDLPSGGNAIAVRPGNRSIGFSSFFGLDERGAVAAFVTDFHMIHIPPPRDRASAVLEAWEREKLVEIAKYARRDPLIDALADQLDAIDRAPFDGTAELAQWLFDRSEIPDVHGVDEALRASVETVDKQMLIAALGAGAG